MNLMNDKVVIVTGGTRGQGECEVRLLVEAGAKVVFGGRDVDKGRAIESDLGGRAFFQQMDVSIEADWISTVAFAEKKFGKVTSLINNAGVTITGLVTGINADEVLNGIRINQLGQLLGMKHIVPALRRNGG
ncbi:MAG: SDR family NAD(P)-dependent oxidoreductase, partial [Microcoleus sp. T3-bin5]|nr:SDR family NAD(P)-dependent oxidoreductase [Microcoleus sp. T3-bin5]